MKTSLLPYLVLAVALVAPASASDKAQIESRCHNYHAAGKAVVAMTISKQVDAAVVEKQVNLMLTEAVWLAQEYAKTHPAGARLLKTVTDHVEAMRKLSFDELEHEWHDLGYFSKPGQEAGLDLSAEENEHFTDPIHTIVHPLLVLKAAQAYAKDKKDEDLKAMKAEMEEGLEQAEKMLHALTKA
jgi:hypothetical protein